MLRDCWSDYRHARQSPLWAESYFRCQQLTVFYECGELKQAAFDFKPSLLAKGTYEIAKAFAAFYNHRDCRVMGVEPGIMAARARLVRGARRMLAGGLELLGMAPLEEM